MSLTIEELIGPQRGRRSAGYPPIHRAALRALRGTQGRRKAVPVQPPAPDTVPIPVTVRLAEIFGPQAGAQ